jgi:hypothetical protein
LVDKNNAVFFALLHGTGGAGGHTPGILAVETGHEDKRHARQSTDELGAHLDDLTKFRPNGQILIGLALYLACLAPDTFFGILKQVILTHCSIPFQLSKPLASGYPLTRQVLGQTAVTVTKVS